MRPWHASATSKPPPSAAPCTAATTGLGESTIFSTARWPARTIASASAAVRSVCSISMSAPAIQVSALPETRIAALIFGSLATWPKTRSKSAAKLALSVFTAAPGTS
jgi:hypothetical protein